MLRQVCHVLRELGLFGRDTLLSKCKGRKSTGHCSDRVKESYFHEMKPLLVWL